MCSRYTAVVCALMLTASPALANMVWPALFLEVRLFSWWAISLGLLIEFLAIRWIFKIRWSKAVVADVAANFGSALLGIPLIPMAGILWELFPGSVYMHFLKWGTFNPITWGATYVLAILINAAVESFVLRRFFRLPVGRKQFFALAGANALSVGVAFVSLFLAPIEP